MWAVDWNEAALKGAFAEFDESRVRTARLDVTDGAGVKALAKRIEQTTGLYGVVNSAGVALPPGMKRAVTKGATELDIDSEVLPILMINLVGTMRCNAACFDAIWKSKGVYVNVVYKSSVRERRQRFERVRHRSLRWPVASRRQECRRTPPANMVLLGE